jgi:DNA-binding CsgD family transcriptional regulator/tetratricopeptide (TPR) repeat protein
MQRAYPESLDLFVQVARLATGAVMVVCCRPTGLDLGHPLARRLAEIQRQRGCEYVPLGSLSRLESGELLEKAAGGPLDRRLVDAAFAESGGNPFFLAELARHLFREGGQRLMAGRLPESVRGAVGLRLAGLSAQTRHMLQLASVFTAGFGFAELQALTGLEEEVLLGCVEQALAEELLTPSEGERYDFAHELVRQTLYEQLSPSRRARLHRRLAEALERLHEQDPAPVAGELVRQYHASASLPGADRGAPYALTAARVARAASAPGDAVTVLRLGLDLVAAGDTKARAGVLGELARAEAEAGLFDDAPRTFDAAVALLEQGGATGEEIAGLVYEVGFASTFAAAADSLQTIGPLIARALTAVGQSQGLAWARLKLLNRFAGPTAVGPIRVLAPVRFDPEAVRVARREGTELDYAFTLDPYDPHFGVGLQRVIARVEGWHDPVSRLRGLVPIVGYLTLLESGSSPATDRLTFEVGALADDVGFLLDRALTRGYRAALFGARGEFEDALEQLEQARALFERQPRSGSIKEIVTVVGELTRHHVAADWPKLGARMWDLAGDSGDSVGLLSLACAGFAAQAFALAEDEDRALEILRYVVPALESSEPWEPAVRGAIGLAGAAVWELGDKDLAERLLPPVLELADADGFEFYMTSSELTAARLSAVLGRIDEAIEYFERARVTLDRRDQRVMRAIVDYDEALVRLAHRQPGGSTLLGEASARFEALGMREWSRRAALVKAADRDLPNRLTAREAEILRLVAIGKTNKEIAAALVISVHTVERHVQNAYRKINARNRADASTYVARAHL